MADEEVMFRILSRLPVKSLARFRCVCKLWSKYINDPYLRTIHVQEEPMPIMFERFFTPQDKIKISLLCSVQQDPVVELGYEPGPSPYCNKLLLGSCNGLILVSYEKRHCHAGAYRFAVINPLSKQRYDLPPIFLHIHGRELHLLRGPCDAIGFGFDDSTNTLKTVFTFHPNGGLNMSRTMVHSEGTSSWREIPDAYPISCDGVFSHGRLHWLTNDYFFEYDPGIDERKIVWFDVKTEEFGIMDCPRKPKEEEEARGEDFLYEDIELADLNGEVGFVYFGPIRITLWILKLEEGWMSHCCFERSLVETERHNYDLKVSGCWNKDGDILFNYNDGEGLFVYTLKTGELRQVLEEQDEESFGHIRMYQSSLFLLNKSGYSIT